jgi:acetylornithine deacetylase/succinyl-diaminopimelate desuccinylase-like protein
MLPDEDPAKFLEQVKTVVNDPAVDVHYVARDVRPGQPDAKLDSEAFKAVEAAVTKNYGTVTLPTMSTGATDMAYLRAKGMQCFGLGPATDIEDGPKGFDNPALSPRTWLLVRPVLVRPARDSALLV